MLGSLTRLSMCGRSFRRSEGVDQTGAPALSSMGFIVSGFLVGLGTRLSNGCTSGHGLCGLPRLSRRSIVATLTFLTRYCQFWRHYAHCWVSGCFFLTCFFRCRILTGFLFSKYTHGRSAFSIHSAFSHLFCLQSLAPARLLHFENALSRETTPRT